jgi:hypothetical protein
MRQLIDSSGNALLAKVETVSENKKEKSLDYMSVRNYCQNLFEFQTITIRKFKSVLTSDLLPLNA